MRSHRDLEGTLVQVCTRFGKRHGNRASVTARETRRPIEQLERRVLLSTTMINHSGGFAGASDLQLNGGAAITGSSLVLTDGGGGEARSALSMTSQGVASFDTTFTFTYGTTVAPNADGMTFAIVNGSNTAIGGGGGGIGYTGIANSAAVKFDLWDSPTGTPANSQTGLFTNGNESDDPRGGVSATPVPIGTSVDLTKTSGGTATGIDFHANPGDTYQVHLNYPGGTTLAETVTDTTKGISVSQTYDLGGQTIPQIIGGSGSANVGFTGGTGGAVADQSILTWSFTGNTPEPGALALGAVAAVMMLRRRRRASDHQRAAAIQAPSPFAE